VGKVDLFDKLNGIIDSFADAGTEPGAERFDPDFSDAWQELESFMRGNNFDGDPKDRPGAGSTRGHDGSRRAERSVPQELERDFHNLEVGIGAPWQEVQRAYKRQMAQYHPDRFASYPKKYATATEITKQLNYSYQRLKQFYNPKAG